MKLLSVYIPAISFVLVSVALTIWTEPVEYLAMMLSGMNIVSYVTYVALLVIAVVVMPLTVMPLIPFASSMMGPFMTAVLSIIGWTLGAVIAFCIARYIGRPILSRYVSLDKIDSFVESLPPNTRFFVIVLIRLTVPVDIASYALGFVKEIGIVEYTLATALGVAWFSFAFAYLGEALTTGNVLLIVEIVSASLLVFLGGWYMLRTRTKSNTED